MFTFSVTIILYEALVRNEIKMIPLLAIVTLAWWYALSDSLPFSKNFKEKHICGASCICRDQGLHPHKWSISLLLIKRKVLQCADFWKYSSPAARNLQNLQDPTGIKEVCVNHAVLLQDKDEMLSFSSF